MTQTKLRPHRQSEDHTDHIDKVMTTQTKLRPHRQVQTTQTKLRPHRQSEDHIDKVKTTLKCNVTNTVNKTKLRPI